MIHPNILEIGIEQINKGESIAVVSSGDLKAAREFFTDLREKVPSAVSSRTGFLLNELAVRCGEHADVLAVAIRALILDQIVDLPSRGKDGRPLSIERLTDLVAKAPLTADDLPNPERIIRGTE